MVAVTSQRPIRVQSRAGADGGAGGARRSAEVVFMVFPLNKCTTGLGCGRKRRVTQKSTQSTERMAPFSSPISVETDKDFCPQRRGFIREPHTDRRFSLCCCRNPSWGVCYADAPCVPFHTGQMLSRPCGGDDP